MSLRTVLCLSIATLGVFDTCNAASPVYTTRTRFRIPYRYDATEMVKLGAKEIRLYVSTDSGSRWQQAMTVSPESGRFEYEAPNDGEYWFAVRTLDGGNRLHPQGQIIEPELRVIVDTTAPTLEVQLKQVEVGKVQLTWTAADSNLNARELRLEYLQPGQGDWQQVSILPQATGQTSWNVPQGGVVAVRGTVADLAGNMGRGQNQLKIDAGGGLPSRPGVPDLRQPVAGGDGSIPQDQSASNDPLAANDPFGTSSAAPVVMPGDSRGGRMSNGNLVTDDGSRPEVLRGRYQPVESGGTELPTASSKTRFVSARKFHIGYKLEDVGPSGVSAVELFITEDGGRKWYKYGVDPDNQSPFEVEVPRDGNYGFAIRVRSGAGLANDPPQPGETPSILVVCDQVGPQVQILPPQQGRNENLNKILIRWKAVDENPQEKSISLSYAADLAGPWQPITGWVSNTGSYVWSVGPTVPARIYIRITARDAAGNLSKAETQEPVVVDLTKPSARIVDVEANEVSTFPR